MIDERYSLETPTSTLRAAEDLLNRLVPKDGGASTVSVEQVKGASLLMGTAIKAMSLKMRMRPSDAQVGPPDAASRATPNGPFKVYSGGGGGS